MNVPVSTVVFVSNATIGINTVLRNLVWDADGNDEILYFDTIYPGCGKTIDYIVESSYGRVSARVIPILYPCEDDAIVSSFHDAVSQSRKEGKRPRVCVYDVVSSQPGVRFPFEAVTAACRDEGILSCIDGAQGIGMVKLDLAAVDPDFFVSNCHKWLHVPRGCAVFYVPERNQALIRSTLPTSHGWEPLPDVAADADVATGSTEGKKKKKRNNPLPPNGKSVFVNAFQFVGTLDNSPYLCVKDSIRWRAEVLGGEDKIMAYTENLAREGGKRVASILGTNRVLENESKTLGRCAMVNVALPLAVAFDGDDEDEKERDPDVLANVNGDENGVKLTFLPAADVSSVTNWIQKTQIEEFKTFVPLFVYRGRWWARLSAQVYLDMEDFEFIGGVLKAVCERAGKGGYK